MKKLIFYVLLSLGALLIAALLTGKFNPPVGEENLSQTETFPTVNPILSVPSLDISVPIIFPHSREEGDVQTALESGVAHFPGTALPGQTGNVYLVGHSSDLPFSDGEYKAVFSKLPKMEVGDQIKIANLIGEFTYEVFETKVVEPEDMSVLQQPGNRKLLTLQTSYPIGTTLQRFIVVAELVQ